MNQDAVTTAWRRTIERAASGDTEALGRMAQIVNAVLDVREAFIRGDADAPEFAREIATAQVESLVE